MPNYSKEGKIERPLNPEDFKIKMDLGLEAGQFKRVPQHPALIAFLYYSGVRISEALSLIVDQFDLQKTALIVDIGARLKHSKKTPPLFFSRRLPFSYYIIETVKLTLPGRRLWPYSRKTGYNIVRRVFKYPHYFRLNRITNMFSAGRSITQVRSWTGLTLNTLNNYIGIVDNRETGKELE